MHSYRVPELMAPRAEDASLLVGDDGLVNQLQVVLHIVVKVRELSE
jgi:hypothetical protein